MTIATNWKFTNVRHTRGGLEHEMKSITIYASPFFAKGNISVRAKDGGIRGGSEIYLEIKGLTIEDLEVMIRQATQAICEMKQNVEP
jgi:hypothetical protein